jgi:hypothetical protein
MYKSLGGVRFELDSVTISPKQVLDVMYYTDKPYKEFKKAKMNYGIAGVLGFTGGIMLGFPIGTAIAGGKPEWLLAAGGAAVILTSIPFSIAFKRRARNAVDLYNIEKSQTSTIKTSFYFRGNQAGVLIRF